MSKEHSRPAEGAPGRLSIALSRLAPGATALLCSTELPAPDAGLLACMGLVPSRPIRVFKQGEPCIVQVGGTRIGLTRRVAERLQVVPLGGGRAAS